VTDTDNPLKSLILTYKETFAEWLLGKRLRSVRTLTIELPASRQRSDLFFEAVSEDGNVGLLHIELQGKRSAAPMPWRMLDYMSRTARHEWGRRAPQGSLSLQSVVLYVGAGAGAGDMGDYVLTNFMDQPSLAWRYDVIRLWELEADAVLQMNKPALLALVGQMRMTEPERIVPVVLGQIQAVPDGEQRSELLTALINLIGDEGVLKMIERMIDMELLDTPYLRRIRQESWEKGVGEGRQEGRREGVEEGRREGVEEGLRAAVLAAVTARFNPPVQTYQRLEHRLRQVRDVSVLLRLLEVIIRANTLDEFQSRLETTLAGHNAEPTGGD
jgi:predicted transposase YdaD